MGPTPILLVEEGPVRERLASLFDRPDNEPINGSNKGGRMCTAHILAPHLILLDLSHTTADHPELWRRHCDATASEAPIFKLAVAKQQLGDRVADVLESHVEPDSDSFATGDDAGASEFAPALPQEPVLQIGPVRMDRHGHWAYLNDKKLHLTPTEFRLLECFLREPGRAFTRSQLLDVSIGNASFVLERTIDVHIRSLRTKLGSARDLIETVRGVGYRFRKSSDLL